MRNRPKFIVIMLALIILALIIYLPGGRMSHANALTTAQKPNVALSQFYAQHNLLSDGAVPADLTNSAVVNAWGLVSGPTTPWWIADNGSGKTTLYTLALAPSRPRSQFPA